MVTPSRRGWTRVRTMTTVTVTNQQMINSWPWERARAGTTNEPAQATKDELVDALLDRVLGRFEPRALSVDWLEDL